MGFSFMASFGKRNAATTRPTDTQPPRQKVFPHELQQGEVGNLLRAAGIKPDDESNVVPTREAVDARIARDKAAHDARWTQVNRAIAAKTNGGSMRPLFLIPEPCWNGETGSFLSMELKLSQYEDW